MKPSKVKGIVALAIAALLIILAVSGFYRVEQGEEALVLTFGKMTKHEINAGLYWHVPLAQTVEKISTTKVHTIEYGYRTTQTGSAAHSAQYADVAEEAIMITGDDNLLRIEAMYQFVIQDAEAFLFNVDDQYTTLQLAFETVLRRNIQSKPVDDALLNKQTIGIEVQQDFQRVVDAYRLGISVRKVEIQNAAAPEEVSAAFQDVINATLEKNQRLEEAEKYQNEVLPAARADAYEMIQEAEGYKAEKIAQATGDAANFQEVYARYASSPKITRQRLFIETMERILQKADIKYVVDGDSGVLQFLPLDQAAGGDQ